MKKVNIVFIVFFAVILGYLIPVLKDAPHQMAIAGICAFMILMLWIDTLEKKKVK